MPKGKVNREGLILGIDVGSVSISVISIDMRGSILKQAYALHHGNIRGTLDDLINEYQGQEIIGMASPSGKVHFREDVSIYDQQVALIEAMASMELNARSLLHVGAERFFLIELDDEGNYLQTSHSSSCAAGTGSFLDQQALRLNLTDTAHLSDIALQNQSSIPDIAARCSVFAKTDLIHAQQKGYGLEAICDSLCKGLADNISDTLFNKAVPESPIYMSGGVSKNRSVVRHLQRIIGKEIRIHPWSHHLPALGAAQLLRKEIQTGKEPTGIDPQQILVDHGALDYFFRPLNEPAAISQDNIVEEQYIHSPVRADHTMGVQVDRFKVSSPDLMEFYLGIDVGSTSTKAVLVNTQGEAFAGFYTYTSGQPLKATLSLFEAIDHLAQENKSNYQIVACGTTGSGRKFIGGIVGANQVIDEITA
ncbi:MAG: hypothetical protein KAT15_23180, partial [Bacteroidales bacterium]|nr:hypothetical protein [Bacteroidales bacterium]